MNVVDKKIVNKLIKNSTEMCDNKIQKYVPTTDAVICTMHSPGYCFYYYKAL